MERRVFLAGATALLAAPHARRRLNAAQRPAQLPEGNNLLLLRVAQDVGHAGAGTTVPVAVSTS
jgi:hypothetical protein